MMMACKRCMFLTEEEVCPLCGGEVSKDWQGMLVILDHEASDIARHMEIKANGKYALKVR